MTERGKYIVIEGHDGTGKSTQVETLRKRLAASGIQSVKVEEPAGIAIADELRTIIKNGDLQRDAITNLLLFTAARREIDSQVIVPSLEQGTWVVAARNWISTMAYQGYGEGLNRDDIWETTKQFTSEGYVNPDFTCVLSLRSEVERAKRIAQRGTLENPDTFESRDDDFQNRVKAGYEELAHFFKYPVIDASTTADEVYAEIWQHIEPLTEAA